MRYLGHTECNDDMLETDGNRREHLRKTWHDCIKEVINEDIKARGTDVEKMAQRDKGSHIQNVMLIHNTVLRKFKQAPINLITTAHLCY